MDRGGPVVGNQEAAQIFIIYMHDMYSPRDFIFRHQYRPKFEPEQFEALAKKCENTIHMSKIPSHG